VAGSIYGHDAHIYAHQWHLECLHAFSLSFVLYYHYVYERVRSSKTVIFGLVLAIRKFSSYFYVVLLAAVFIRGAAPASASIDAYIHLY
jgi:hypothetical protein